MLPYLPHGPLEAVDGEQGACLPDFLVGATVKFTNDPDGCCVGAGQLKLTADPVSRFSGDPETVNLGVLPGLEEHHMPGLSPDHRAAGTDSNTVSNCATAPQTVRPGCRGKRRRRCIRRE